MRWHIGKPYFDYARPFRWCGAIRWAWYIYALITLADILKEVAPEKRPPVQITALAVLWLLARSDLRRRPRPSQWFKHYRRKLL